jgi:hypothetical protein
MTTETFTLADLMRERGYTRPEDRADGLWAALMVCHDCPHRMIDHDEIAFRCRVCRCDQAHRGLSARADDRLLALGVALREAAQPDSTGARE